jgi:hypothetical protein
MPPKRKAAAKKEPAKKAAKTDAEPSGDPAPSASDKPAASPKKGKPLGSMSATEVWGLSEYVQSGKMTQEGFAALLQGIGIELMTFEAIYFQYRLAPTPDSVEDPHTVCSSKHALQSCLDGLGARKLEDVPEKLKRKKAALQSDYGDSFPQFFRWLFEMGKAISAANLDVAASAVRTVPLAVGLMLMEAALSSWPLMPQLKAFCEEKHAQPITKVRRARAWILPHHHLRRPDRSQLRPAYNALSSPPSLLSSLPSAPLLLASSFFSSSSMLFDTPLSRGCPRTCGRRSVASRG